MLSHRELIRLRVLFKNNIRLKKNQAMNYLLIVEMSLIFKFFFKKGGYENVRYNTFSFKKAYISMHYKRMERYKA